MTHPNPMDTLDLRRAFSRFGTGVTVVTTRTPEGQRLGVTASSFNTVSLAPPIVLWSLAERSPSLAGFRAAGRFVVNVLALEQLALAQRFARPAPAQASDKFVGVECRAGLHGQPVLAGCAASIECRIVGDQTVGGPRAVSRRGGALCRRRRRAAAVLQRAVPAGREPDAGPGRQPPPIGLKGIP